MDQSQIYTSRSERYVLPDGRQQAAYKVHIEEPSSLGQAVKLLLELHKTLKAFHNAGGVPDGAVTVDFSAEVPAGDILFVPFILGRGEKQKKVAVSDIVAQLPSFGLRLATPYETLWWFKKILAESVSSMRPDGLESAGVFAFGDCKHKSRALLIAQMSCRIMYVLGRRQPDYYPMSGAMNIPYYFSIATVVNIPTVVRANQHVRLHKPVLAKTA